MENATLTACTYRRSRCTTIEETEDDAVPDVVSIGVGESSHNALLAETARPRR